MAPTRTHNNTPSALLTQRQRWATLLHSNHYQTLISEVLTEELPKYHTSRSIPLLDSLENTTRECILMLASTPPVFSAALDGTLFRRFVLDSEFRNEDKVVEQRAHVQPSIYLHLLVDDKGVAPSAQQLLIVRKAVLQYLNFDETKEESKRGRIDMISKIDNMTAPSIPRSATVAGRRKYLWTKNCPSKYVQTLHTFCNGILERYNDTPMTERNLPLQFPLAECGYSRNSHIRLAQHRNRQPSNYVMNLIEDICAYLHSAGVFTQNFSMHQYILYFIFRPEQAAIAEIFCSGILQVWVEVGGGMNSYPAGRSVASARRVSARQWVEHERWVRENTAIRQMLKLQKEILEMIVRSLDEEMGECWRESVESCEEEGEDVMDGD